VTSCSLVVGYRRFGSPAVKPQTRDWCSIHDKVREGNFSLHHRVQTGSGAHPASYQWVSGSLFTRGVKRPGREAELSPQFSAEVTNAWSYTSTYSYIFMAWYLVKHRDFNFPLLYVYSEFNSSSWLLNLCTQSSISNICKFRQYSPSVLTAWYSGFRWLQTIPPRAHRAALRRFHVNYLHMLLGQHNFLFSVYWRNYTLPEELVVAQLVKKVPKFYGTGMFITVFTTAHQMTLLRARWIYYYYYYCCTIFACQPGGLLP
jgi:hypothetical protein